MHPVKNGGITVGHIRIVENARLADGTRNHKWPIMGPSFTEFESLTVFTP